MRWMLTELLAIKAREEKAIVFCELRELQRTIQYAIVERLGLIADIINGDTPLQAKGLITVKGGLRFSGNDRDSESSFSPLWRLGSA
jgi:hypothetical protein